MHVNVNMDCLVYSLTFCSRAKSCTVDEANKLRYIFVQREFALTQKNDEINSLCREMRVSRTQPKQKWVAPSRAASFRGLCDRYRHCALCRRWNRYHAKCAYSLCAPRPHNRLLTSYSRSRRHLYVCLFTYLPRHSLTFMFQYHNKQWQRLHKLVHI